MYILDDDKLESSELSEDQPLYFKPKLLKDRSPFTILASSRLVRNRFLISISGKKLRSTSDPKGTDSSSKLHGEPTLGGLRRIRTVTEPSIFSQVQGDVFSPVFTDGHLPKSPSVSLDTSFVGSKTSETQGSTSSIGERRYVWTKLQNGAQGLEMPTESRPVGKGWPVMAQPLGAGLSLKVAARVSTRTRPLVVSAPWAPAHPERRWVVWTLPPSTRTVLASIRSLALKLSKHFTLSHPSPTTFPCPNLTQYCWCHQVLLILCHAGLSPLNHLLSQPFQAWQTVASCTPALRTHWATLPSNDYSSSAFTPPFPIARHLPRLPKTCSSPMPSLWKLAAWTPDSHHAGKADGPTDGATLFPFLSLRHPSFTVSFVANFTLTPIISHSIRRMHPHLSSSSKGFNMSWLRKVRS